jgi:hypothetical protein
MRIGQSNTSPPLVLNTSPLTAVQSSDSRTAT